MHNRRLESWFVEMTAQQDRRITRLLHRDRERHDPGGTYTLTIRGHKPAQIRLEETPDDIHRRNGEIGRRINDGYFFSGS